MKQKYELHIVYDPLDGETVPDAQIKPMVEEIVQYVSEQDDYHISTGSELVINEIRIHIKNKTLDTDLTVIYFNNEEVLINMKGQFIEYPEGFCDTYENQLDKLIDWSLV